MTESTQLRVAQAADTERIAQVAHAAYSVYLPRLPDGVQPAPMEADYDASVSRGEVWVADLAGRVAGFVVLVAEPDHLLLDNVAVHPDCQGRGVGRLLMDFAEQEAARLGLPSIRLFTNAVMTENQRLYERLGYVETDRRREHGLDRVFFEKRLT